VLRLTLILAVLLPLAYAKAADSNAASQPTTAPSARFIAFGGGEPDLRTPGFHKLLYLWQEEGQRRYASFSVFLPQGFGETGRRWPLLVFLAGLGDRGADPGNAMAVGVPLEIGRSDELAKWMPMVVLTPQCPADKVWDTPGVGAQVVRLVHALLEPLTIDAARVYVTGFSDGGKGSWVVASEEPSLFAVTAPIVSREYKADETARRFAGTGITCLVISGTRDPKSEPASSRMAEALRGSGVDVVYAPVPDAQHFIWRAFYSQKAFYEFLLAHRRGEAPPANRLTGEQVIALYTSKEQLSLRQQIYEHRLQKGLDAFEPYWFVDNCAESQELGLRPKALGRPKVYATLPLSADIACRLQTTRQLPADKFAELSLEVGHPPAGQWVLVIRVNEQEKLRSLISDQTAPTGWTKLSLDLREYAGGEARIQLIHSAAAGNASSLAYWSSIKLTETPRPSGK